MSGLAEIIKGITARLDSPETLAKWKDLASKGLKEYAKRANPFKVKASNYYLYIDTRSFTYGIILQGVKPNAGAVRGFTAPVGKYEKTAPHPVHLPYGWRALTKERATSGRAGNPILDTQYYGVTGKPTQFFGLKRHGKPRAYGLIDGVAVPVYSEDGFVEWLTEEQSDELQEILEKAGYSALQSK